MFKGQEKCKIEEPLCIQSNAHKLNYGSEKYSARGDNLGNLNIDSYILKGDTVWV